MVPQARVLRNDARILDAALEAAALDGWAGLTPTAVSRRSGMSQRAVQTRFPQRPDLGAGVWRERAGTALHATLHELMGAVDDEAQTSAWLDTMQHLAQPDAPLRAAVELLVISMFEPTVREAIETTVTPDVRRWCTPSETVSPANAARRAYALMLGLGLLAAGRRPRLGRLNLRPEFESVLNALRSPTTPTALPSDRPVHVTSMTPFDTGDPIHDALLAAALEQVGRLGFDGATTMSIAGAAGVSETTIFVRYPSKLALFVDAASRQQAIAFRTNHEFTRSIAEQYGPGIAAAVDLREFLHPDVSVQRAIYAEEVRISWHDDGLRARLEAEIDAFLDDLEPTDRPNEARAHLEYATGLGYALLPLLLRDAWTLPYDVVTQPLFAEHRGRHAGSMKSTSSSTAMVTTEMR